MKIAIIDLEGLRFLCGKDFIKDGDPSPLLFESAADADDYISSAKGPPSVKMALVDLDALRLVTFEPVEPQRRRWRTGINRRWGGKRRKED